MENCDAACQMVVTVRAKYRIAIAEPDEQMRLLIERWLQAAGHQAEMVTIDSLQQSDGFDLIIADVADPRAALPLIRLVQAAHDAAVLLTSTRFRHGQNVSTKLAQQLGVKAVLPKPFSRAELLRAIGAAMR
jgi:DNA-binding response OmpR family regulator